MIPAMIEEAAKDGGWDITMFSDRSWFGLIRGEFEVHGRRDRWRHTTARAYRGNALSAILTGQRAIADYLRSTNVNDLTEVTTDELLGELGRRIGELHLLDHPRGADIEILDVIWDGSEPPPCIKPSVMRINGTDVGLIERDSLCIGAGGDQFPTTVTVTLFPRSLVLKADSTARPT